MNNQMEARERVISGKGVKKLRRQGIVPASLYGQNEPSALLEIDRAVLRKTLDQGHGNGVLSLKVGSRPPVQAIIKQMQRNGTTGEILHVDFYRVMAAEMLKTHVQLHFVNEPAGLKGGTVTRLLNEVMVECLPADMPNSIEVDLSDLNDDGAVVRVGNLNVGPRVTILNDHNDVVAGVHRNARAEKAEGTEGDTEGATI